MLSMPSYKSKMRYLAWSCATYCFVFLTLNLGALGDAHLNLKVQRGRGRQRENSCDVMQRAGNVEGKKHV